MTGEQVTISGLKPLVRQMKTLDAEVVKEIKSINRAAAVIVATTAEAMAPRRSGKLAGSIRPGATQYSGVVRVGSAKVPYAGPIHFGWGRRHIRPQPFLYRALDSRRDEVFAAYEHQLNAIVERTFVAEAA